MPSYRLMFFVNNSVIVSYLWEKVSFRRNDKILLSRQNIAEKMQSTERGRGKELMRMMRSLQGLRKLQSATYGNHKLESYGRYTC